MGEYLDLFQKPCTEGEDSGLVFGYPSSFNPARESLPPGCQEQFTLEVTV